MKKGKESEQEKGRGGKTQTPSSLLSRRPCTAHLSLSFTFFLAGVTKRLSRSSTPSQKEEERDRRTKQPMRIPTISTVWGGIEGPRRRRPSFIQLSPSSSVGGDKGKKRLASFGPRCIVPREIQPRGIAVSPCQKMREKRGGGMSHVFLAFSLV